MIKSISMFSEVEDLEEFEEFYVKNVCKAHLSLPGVLSVKISSVHQTTEASQKYNGVQVMIETYYESPEIMHQILQSDDAQKIFEMVSNLPSGNMSSFFSNEITLYPPNSQLKI